MARLTMNPESGNPISVDQKTRRLLVTRFQYQVVYRVRPNEIVIGVARSRLPVSTASRCSADSHSFHQSHRRGKP